jgi:hypothetical protein
VVASILSPTRESEADVLRPPSGFDPTAAAYKDWLHLYVFDHPSGICGFVNVSLHGDPRDPRCRAVGTTLFHVPGTGWVGNTEVRGSRDVRVGPASIAMEQVAMAVDPEGSVLASARMPDDGLALAIMATPTVRPFAHERPLPLASGWICWRLQPRLEVRGWIDVADRRIDLSRASAYQDHNWGRWHWGEDLGWDFAALQAPASGIAIVFKRTGDRAHRNLEQPTLFIQGGAERFIFTGPSVEVTFDGSLEATLRRIPGGLAALHVDRVTPSVPARVRIAADDGRDRVAIEFTTAACAQIIAGDPTRSGYGFIHEVVGAFRCEGRAGRVDLDAEGLGVLELVD